MRIVEIFQTLEDRGNYGEIKEHGPYFCGLYNKDGSPKTGSRVPWLGEGFYFWDTRIDDARWWGNATYLSYGKGYVICKTRYDQHSDFLYDLVGDVSQFEEFVDCARLIRKQRHLEKVTFPVVLAFLRKNASFTYKAIRVRPETKRKDVPSIVFPGSKNNAHLGFFDKIQIYFFDNSLFMGSFEIAETKKFQNSYTI